MREMLDTVRAEAARYRIGNFFDLTDPRNGISHVAGPEQGFALPGSTLVCGDSHTSTHGAFGALAFGIGASEVEHVLATQALLQRRPGTMLVELEGQRPAGVHAKDVVLALIGRIGIGGGTGCVIEYAGDAVREMSMEERMTVCNMTIEAGARAGMMAPDETTYEYLAGTAARPGRGRPGGGPRVLAHPALRSGRTPSTGGSRCGWTASSPQVTWGTNPSMVAGVDGGGSEDGGRGQRQRGGGVDPRPRVHGPRARHPHGRPPPRAGCSSARAPTAGSPTFGIAAGYVKGRRVADGVHAMVVPGSGLVKRDGGSGRHRPDLPRGRFRVAGARLLDVRRDEQRPPFPRGAVRLDEQPELRRAARDGAAGPIS